MLSHWIFEPLTQAFVCGSLGGFSDTPKLVLTQLSTRAAMEGGIGSFVKVNYIC